MQKVYQLTHIVDILSTNLYRESSCNKSNYERGKI